MKKVLAVITVLAGGIAVAASVMQRLGRLSPFLKVNSGVAAFIGKPDAPSAVFVISKAVPLVFSNLFVHFFGSISALSTKSLLTRMQRSRQTKKA